MVSFVVTLQPKSYNSNPRRRAVYQNRLQDAFRAAHPAHLPLTGELYGLVYHFFRNDLNLDADNLSKPVWDGLSGVLFSDDKQVKMRIAGSFDITANDLTILDFSGLPGDTIALLLEAIEAQSHVLYVECGKFTTGMIRLNIENNGA